MTPSERQREEDAAQFEDWSPWRGLVYLMPVWGVFELRPATTAGSDRIARIPGIARSTKHGHLNRGGNCGTPPWHLPLAHWQALRTALPEIQAADEAALAARRAEAAAIEARTAEADRAALKVAIDRALKSPAARDVAERIAVIATAYLNRDRRLTAWERSFVVNLANRHHRCGDRMVLTDPQRRRLDEIHDKVADTMVL